MSCTILKHAHTTFLIHRIHPKRSPTCSSSYPATPLVDAITQRGQKTHEIPFHVPGHKRGSIIPPPLAPLLHSDNNNNILQYDLTELPGLDYLSYPEGPILKAQQLAAEAWSADQTWFLVNGSTTGIHAAVLSTCTQPTDVLILARNCHLSSFNAAALSGCHVRYVYPHIQYSTAHYVTPEDIENEIQHVLRMNSCENHAIDTRQGIEYKVKAVMIVSPTYYGIISDIRGISEICHKYGAVLIVDEAHGAHLNFLDNIKKTPCSTISTPTSTDNGEAVVDAGSHGCTDLSALRAGADIVIQSTHKQLAALTQGAMLHIKESNRVDAACISRLLQVFQTSSPSYLIMASLDAARAQAQQGDAVHASHEAAMHLRRWFDSRTPAAAIHNTTTTPSKYNNNSNRKEENPADILLLTPSLLSSPIPPKDTNKKTSAPFHPPLHGIIKRDPWRFTVLLRNMPHTLGWDVSALLEQEYGVVAELATSNSIVFAFGIGSTKEHADGLIQALEWLVDGQGWKKARKRNINDIGDADQDVDVNTRAKSVLSPGEALRIVNGRTATKKVPAADAVGHISAELLCPYPPGIPLICPGEVFTADIVKQLHDVVRSGGKVVGAEDLELDTVRVIMGRDYDVDRDVLGGE